MSAFNHNLNEKQYEAVSHLDGPLLIVAGAGSGKTKTLTSRLAAILATGVAPENIIAITFTNKAAEEMAKRVEQTIGSQAILPFIGTFHSLGVRILKKEAHLAERTPNFSIFDDDDSLKIIKAIVKNSNFKESRLKELNPTSLRREFSRIKGELSDIDDKEDIIAFLFKEYEEALKKNNAFDFDDLIEKPIRIFQEYNQILEKYQERFRYILVDEFQDTNTSQYVFVKLMAQKYKNLSVVGDDAQSIYKFRGSDFKIFLNFERDWPETKVVFLEQNYRSTENIIKSASALIGNNKVQKHKNLWTENIEGELIKIIEHQNEDEEAWWIAEQIAKLKNENDKSIAILYRTNAQSRAIESALIECGITYHIFGGLKFYERKEIKDIVAALRWAANQKDSMSFDRLKTNFLKKPFLEITEKVPAAAQKLKPAELIGYILEISDYFSSLRKHYDNFNERVENINELIYFAGGFNDLSEFLEKISLLQAADMGKGKKGREERSKEKGIVNLMTVHLAKGLEFDKVFIVGCNEGLMPHQMSYRTDDEIEEERRLMYVAMTRARQELYINFYNIPSRFLSEIPPELVDYKVQGNLDLDDEERYITLD